MSICLPNHFCVFFYSAISVLFIGIVEICLMDVFVSVRDYQNFCLHVFFFFLFLLPANQLQIDPAKYKSISAGFGVLLKEKGFGGIFKGWVPTLLGYSAQGGCKFGFYELFKKFYSDLAGPDIASKYKALIYLVGSASAEVIADVALCPMEAVKVRVQTQPGFAKGLIDGFPKFVESEGVLGYHCFYFVLIV